MPKPATQESAQGEHLKEYVLMLAPGATEPQPVKADPAAIVPLMIAGWKQVLSEGTKE